MTKYRFSGLRNPGTLQESRLHQEEWVEDRHWIAEYDENHSEEFQEWFFVPIRGKRKPHNLPNAWDDIQRNDKGDGWKNFRSTQYKIKSNKPKRDSFKYALSMSKRDHLHFEHRHCSWKGRRCKYCVKHNLWAEHDKEIERKHKEIQEDWKKWDRFYGWTDHYFSPAWWARNIRREWVEVRSDDYNVVEGD